MVAKKRDALLLVRLAFGISEGIVTFVLEKLLHFIQLCLTCSGTVCSADLDCASRCIRVSFGAPHFSDVMSNLTHASGGLLHFCSRLFRVCSNCSFCSNTDLRQYVVLARAAAQSIAAVARLQLSFLGFGD